MEINQVDQKNLQSEKPQYIENQLLGHRLTPEGYKEVRWQSGKEIVIEPIDELTDFPKKFKEVHRKAFNAICFAVTESIEQGRKMPIFREELITNLGLEKQWIKDLIDMNLLGSELLNVSTAEGKKLGGRLAVFLSPQGRALKKNIEQIVLSEAE